jgi:hypothetical protein
MVTLNPRVGYYYDSNGKLVKNTIYDFGTIEG